MGDGYSVVKIAKMKEKRFINLSPKDSEGLEIIIFKNARQLNRDAIVLANKKSFSTANSLLILSSEEIVKSILVFLHSKGYKVYQIPDAKKFFTDHLIRHNIIMLIEFGLGLLDVFEKWEERKLKPKTFNFKSKFWSGLLNGLEEFVELSMPVVDSVKRIEQTRGFNRNKNKGLYVDFRGQLINPQKEISQDVFIETKAIVERIFRFYKILKLFHHPCFKYHYPEGKIGSKLEELKLFCNNAMSDFSFKELN